MNKSNHCFSIVTQNKSPREKPLKGKSFMKFNLEDGFSVAAKVTLKLQALVSDTWNEFLLFKVFSKFSHVSF